MTRRRFAETKLEARLAEYDGRCDECGIKTGGAAGLEWDHITPLGLGGADEIENLRPLCRGCHRTVKTPDDIKKIRKARRLARRAAGIKKTSQYVLPGNRNSPWKRKASGEWVRREDE